MTRLRARRRARLGGVAAVVGCAVAVAMVVLGGGLAAGAADHAGHADAVPTLATVVIPAVAPGYTVTSQGPLDVSEFASDAPDPTAASRALSTLGGPISTYERVWQADRGLNQVQDLLVRFPDPARAQVFLQAAQHSLEIGRDRELGPVAVHPGFPPRHLLPGDQPRRGRPGHHHARRDLRRSPVHLLGGGGQRAPHLPRQRRSARRGPARGDGTGAGWRHDRHGRRPTARRVPRSAPSAWPCSSSPSWRLAVAAPGLLRRRRLAQEAAAPVPPLHHVGPPSSAGDAVDDLREHSG